MLGPSWIQLFRRIPVEHHHSLSVVSTTGLEIVVQSIVRLESEYVILRGRMAGTNDAGRVLIMPYDQMTFLGFNKMMMDPEIQGIFGPPEFNPFAPSAPQAEAKPELVLPPAATPAPGEVKANANGPPGAKSAPLSKSILLARLRQRLANEGK